jgi:hypothetical protein
VSRNRWVWTVALLILLALLIGWYAAGFRATQP